MSKVSPGDRRQSGARFMLARRRRLAVAAVAGVVLMISGRGEAQVAPPCFPSYICVPTTNATPAVSAALAQFDLGTRFMGYLAGQGGTTWQGAPNAGGGGADAPTAAPASPAAASPPVWRAWAEGYGQRTHTGAQTDFAGDHRRSLGGVAGIGIMPAPGAMIGLSVDQSHTKIDVTDLPQRATLDLTQIGLNGVYETGPWTISAAGVYGFAKIDSSRDTFFGPATAAYDARLFGTVAELTYYRGFGTFRVVPKLGLDWLRTETDAFTETGGVNPTSVSRQVAQRARVYAGAEIGNTWVMENRMFDLSAYGRVVDIYWREVPTLLLSSGFLTPQTVQGAVESRLGFDTGVMASYRFARNARVYAGYDGRFRDGYQAHGGTLGLEVRW